MILRNYFNILFHRYTKELWQCVFMFVCFFLKRFYLFTLEKGGKREKERKRNMDVWLPLTAPTRDLACNPACARIGNRTSDPLVHRPALNPVSHTSQGRSMAMFKEKSPNLLKIDIEIFIKECYIWNLLPNNMGREKYGEYG